MQSNNATEPHAHPEPAAVHVDARRLARVRLVLPARAQRAVHGLGEGRVEARVAVGAVDLLGCL